MTKQKDKTKLISAALYLLMIALLLLSITPAAYAANSAADAGSAEEVGVLILLKEQVDTEKAARDKRQFMALSGNQAGDAAAVKNEIRYTVFRTLRETAAHSQAPLLRFLQEEEERGNVSAVHSYYIVNMLYAKVSPALVETIAAHPDVEEIRPDKVVSLVEPVEGPSFLQNSAIEWNISQIGADSVWNELGYDGSGVVVGIIDSGVDWQHETLRSKYRGFNPNAPNNPSHTYNWLDLYYADRNGFPDDFNGHGTHVAGIVLGSGPGGTNRIGVAPGAQWIAARGLDDNGSAFLSKILEAMEWMLAPTPDIEGTGIPNPAMAPDIVNNSWGADETCNPYFKQAINSWHSAGIFSVFAAGNDGPASGTILFPANYAESLAVGATDSSNSLAWFSARGPGACGGFIKPNIVAPGASIRSALSRNPDRDRNYIRWDGTSMAAPHVAGVAALLLSADPHLKVNDLKKIMIDTATPLTSSAFPNFPNHGFGYGLVNAYEAVNSLEFPVNIAVAANPNAGGQVLGGGEYELDSQVTVQAAANTGYAFVKWTENNVEASTQTVYTFKAEKDRTLTAHFMPHTYSSIICWQNDRDGRLDAWVMLGTNKIVQIPLTPESAPTAWKAVAAYDLNNNGSADLVLENINNGLRRVWFMDGLKKVGEANLGVANANFRIADLHDISGDGNLDIVFQNIRWGSRNIWLMQGYTRYDGGPFAVANINWHIVAAEDMDGDGRTNIILEHRIRGERNYWTLDENRKRIPEESGNFYQTGSQWSIALAHDMDVDGKPDLILEHTDGRRSIWLMDGMERKLGISLDWRDPDWKIFGCQ